MDVPTSKHIQESRVTLHTKHLPAPKPDFSITHREQCWAHENTHPQNQLTQFIHDVGASVGRQIVDLRRQLSQVSRLSPWNFACWHLTSAHATTCNCNNRDDELLRSTEHNCDFHTWTRYQDSLGATHYVHSIIRFKINSAHALRLISWTGKPMAAHIICDCCRPLKLRNYGRTETCMLSLR